MNAVVLRLRVAENCEIGKYAVRFVCGWNMAMFSSVHVRSADRGGAAGGGVR